MKQLSIGGIDAPVALVTGAGSGIGRATAQTLAAAGARLIITDLNKASLADTAGLLEAAGAVVEVERVDVSDWDDMQALAERVHRRHRAVDILVNNAGVATAGDFLSTPIEDWHWVLGVNLMGVVHGCKAFAPAMVAQRRGHIVNMASAAGYYAAPDMSAYSASKHAVMGMSESLRLELAQHNIGVSAICPGVINTNIISATRMHGATAKAQGKIGEIYRRRDYGPEHVAAAVLNAIEYNRAVVPVSPEAWALYAAKRFVPGVVDTVQRSSLFRRLRPA